MRVCRDCGHQITNDEYKFCPMCGDSFNGILTRRELIKKLGRADARLSRMAKCPYMVIKDECQ